MVTVIAETPHGAVETKLTDLSDVALAGLVRDGHPAAIEEYWRRRLRPAK